MGAQWSEFIWSRQRKIEKGREKIGGKMGFGVVWLGWKVGSILMGQDIFSLDPPKCFGGKTWVILFQLVQFHFCPSFLGIQILSISI